jgi:hypothetical protein
MMAGDHSRAADKGEPAVVMAYLPRDRHLARHGDARHGES